MVIVLSSEHVYIYFETLFYKNVRTHKLRYIDMLFMSLKDKFTSSVIQFLTNHYVENTFILSNLRVVLQLAD